MTNTLLVSIIQKWICSPSALFSRLSHQNNCHCVLIMCVSMILWCVCFSTNCASSGSIINVETSMELITHTCRRGMFIQMHHMTWTNSTFSEGKIRACVLVYMIFPLILCGVIPHPPISFQLLVVCNVLPLPADHTSIIICWDLSSCCFSIVTFVLRVSYPILFSILCQFFALNLFVSLLHLRAPRTISILRCACQFLILPSP